MWWLPLALAAGKSVLDNKNNKQQLASEVITQKYSPWTGMRADFSMQGKNSFGDNMLKGAAGAMTQYGAEQAAEAGKQADYLAQQKKEGEGYTRGGIGEPIAPQGKSSFAQVAPKAPPVAITTPQAAPSNPLIPNQNPMIFPEAAGANPWTAMAAQAPSQAARLPAQAEGPAPVDPTSGSRAALWDIFNKITPANAPFKGGGFR